MNTHEIMVYDHILTDTPKRERKPTARQASESHRRSFCALCLELGGVAREGWDAGRAFTLPTRLGPLRASIHEPIWSDRRRLKRHCEMVFLQFETFSTGKVYDMLLGWDFNGHSGKWNIDATGEELPNVRRHALDYFKTRIEMLATADEAELPKRKGAA